MSAQAIDTPADQRHGDTTDTARGQEWRPRPAHLVSLAVLGFVAALVVHHVVFPYLSADADEPVYRFQAHMLLAGKLNLSVPQQFEFFQPWLAGISHANGRLVLAFTWGWPAVLAASQWLFGTMIVAVGAASSLAVVACYLFALEIFGHRRRALVAALLFALCPLVLVLGGTYLNYVFALGLELLMGWMVLRGMRTSRRGWLLGAGLVLGFIPLVRPYDALLAAIPLALYVVIVCWRRWGHLARSAGAVVAGAIPGIVVTLLLNVATTGSALLFPTPAQSGGSAKFFWGHRDIVPGHHSMNFTLMHAFGATWTNVVGLLTWPIGTYLAVALAAYGVIHLWRERPAKVALLTAMVAVWPIGYLGWFAIALTKKGAENGLGPHYYLPMIAPLAILATAALFALWERKRMLVLGAAVVGLVLTGLTLPAKWADKRPLRESRPQYLALVRKGLAQRQGRNAIVVLEPYVYYPGVMSVVPQLGNDPDLHNAVLYANGKGPALIDLVERYPDRAPYRIVRRFEPGVPLSTPQVVVKPMSVVSAPTVAFHTRLVNTSGLPVVSAYLAVGKRRIEVPLDRQSSRNKSYDVTWTLSEDGTVAFSGAGQTRTGAHWAGKSGTLAVGGSFAKDGQRPEPNRADRRYYYRLAHGQAQVLTGDTEWSEIGYPYNRWLTLAVGSQVSVEVAAIG